MANPFKSIWHFLVKVFGGDRWKNFATAALALLKTNLGPLALAAVQDAADLGLNGIEAKQHAFDKLKQDGKDILKKAEDSGITIKDAFINLILELALQKIQGTLDPKMAPPALPPAA